MPGHPTTSTSGSSLHSPGNPSAGGSPSPTAEQLGAPWPARHEELGEFLRSRRSRLKPADVGLDDRFGGGGPIRRSSGERRRVPGLRREELAQLAGVSIGYYTRLEQGQSHQASDAVLISVARAMLLDEEETAHLFRLARPQPVRSRRHRAEVLRPAMQVLLDQLGVPALVVGRSRDVLGWNRLGHLLFAGHLQAHTPLSRATRPNVVRLVFLDPHTRGPYVDWLTKARDTVADLRDAATQRPDDRDLAELIGELTMKSPEFARLWAAHPVRVCASQVRRLQHPEVGLLTLAIESLALPDDDGQKLVTFSAEPATPSADCLRLLDPAVAGRSGRP